MVGLRILIFDYRYFNLEVIPNHDMHQGLAFFCTNMHSVRLTGELAWWDPVRLNGYAQYYQSFFAPLAPTPHHISFIAWAQFIRVLSWVGVAIPEYPQYLVVNFVVLPFLATLAFAAFASQLFRRRATLVLVALAWTLSGVGVWHSAWFYFQEPFSLYLLLAAGLAALRRPSACRLLLLLAAALLQITSVNYWTVYNLFFVLIVLGAYAWIYPRRVRRLARRAASLLARRRVAAGLVGLPLLALLVVWAVMLGSMLREQSSSYHREGRFTIKEVLARIKPMRMFTLELFNPNLPEWSSPQDAPNAQSARYLGCALLPLLVLLPGRRWNRQERWLVLTAGGVLAVCLAPPFLLYLWKWIPMMDRVRHTFSFYTHYWQTLLVLLAGTTLEALLRQGRHAAAWRRSRWLAGGLCGLLGVLVLGLHTFSWLMTPPVLEARLRFGVFSLIAAAAVLQMLLVPTPRSRGVLVLLLLGLLLTDLSKYFGTASEADSLFTSRYLQGKGTPIQPEARARLRRPWSDPDSSKGFDGGVVENLPLRNTFWPDNWYLAHRRFKAMQHLQAFWIPILNGPPLAFSGAAAVVPTVEDLQALIKRDPRVLAGHRPLLLQAAHPLPGAGGGTAASGGPPPGEALPSRCQEWAYNSYQFDLTAPRDGWVFVRQQHDPCWRVILDGRRVEARQAEFIGMAVPVSRGRHVLRLEYRPLARRLYGIGCLLLQGVLALLLWSALRARRAAARQRRTVGRPQTGPQLALYVPRAA
jgi:hypothetical protein